MKACGTWLAVSVLVCYADLLLGARVPAITTGGIIAASKDVPEEPAGVQVVARQRLFDYAVQQGLTLLETRVREVYISQYSKTFSLPLVGVFEIRLSNITVTDFQAPPEKAKLSILSGLFNFQATDILGSIDFDWHWEKLGLSGSGSGQLLLQGGSIDYVYSVKQSVAGQPVITVLTAQSQIGSLELKIRSFSADWFYQAVLSVFNGMITSAITSKVEAALNDDVPHKVNDVLASLPTNVTVKGLPFETVFSYSLYTNTYVLIKGYSEVETELPALRSEVSCPLAVTELPLSPELIASRTESVSILIHENTLNCLLWGLFHGDLMHVTVKDGVVPSLRLTTELFAALIPELPKLYPKTPLVLQVTATVPPSVAFDPAYGAMIYAAYNTSVFVAPKSNESTVPDPVFVGSVISYVNITGNFGWESVTITNISGLHVVDASVTEIKLLAWHNLFVWAVKTYAPKYNLRKIFNAFVSAPVVSRVILTQPQTDIYNHWYSLSADVNLDNETFGVL